MTQESNVQRETGADQYKDVERPKLNDVVEDLSRDIKLEKERRLTKVDEQTFIKKLLPLAVCRYTNYADDKEINLSLWNEITGSSPYQGVRVMRGGTELFVTPPLILSPQIEFKGESLFDRLKRAEKERGKAPTFENIMDEDAMQPQLHIPHAADALMTWVLIMRLYGIKLIPIDKEGNDLVEESDTPVVETAPTANRNELWEDDDDDEGEPL